MNLAKKDADILIEARVQEAIPQRIKNAALFGFLIIFCGGLAYLSGKIWGFALVGAGFAVLLTFTIMSSNKKKKAKAEYQEYYNQRGELPPWPTEKK